MIETRSRLICQGLNTDHTGNNDQCQHDGVFDCSGAVLFSDQAQKELHDVTQLNLWQRCRREFARSPIALVQQPRLANEERKDKQRVVGKTKHNRAIDSAPGLIPASRRIVAKFGKCV